MLALANGRRMWASAQMLCEPPTTGAAVVDWEVIDLDTGAVVRSVWTNEKGGRYQWPEGTVQLVGSDESGDLEGGHASCA